MGVEAEKFAFCHRKWLKESMHAKLACFCWTICDMHKFFFIKYLNCELKRVGSLEGINSACFMPFSLLGLLLTDSDVKQSSRGFSPYSLLVLLLNPNFIVIEISIYQSLLRYIQRLLWRNVLSNWWMSTNICYAKPRSNCQPFWSILRKCF